MLHQRYLVLCLLMGFVTSTQAFAGGIYYYLASNGKWYFSDSKKSMEYRPYQKNKPHRFGQIDRRIDRAINFYSLRFEISPNLVRAIIKAESNFNPKAVSRAGAMGLMQLMPQTAKFLNVQNPFSPEENIKGGVQYMSDLLKQYDGDLRHALAAYNAGPTAVARYNGVPPYQETKHYIRSVLMYYQQLESHYDSL